MGMIKTGRAGIVCNVTTNDARDGDPTPAQRKGRTNAGTPNAGREDVNPDPVAVAKKNAEDAERAVEAAQAEADRVAAGAKAKAASAEADKRTRAAMKSKDPYGAAARRLHATAATAHADAADAHKAMAGAKMGLPVEQRTKAKAKAAQHAEMAKKHEMLAGQASLTKNGAIHVNTGRRGIDVTASVPVPVVNVWSDAAREAAQLARRAKSGQQHRAAAEFHRGMAAAHEEFTDRHGGADADGAHHDAVNTHIRAAELHDRAANAYDRADRPYIPLPYAKGMAQAAKKISVRAHNATDEAVSDSERSV